MKLYGMVGLPGERREDIEETIKMLKALKDKMKGKKTFRITFGCSTFVPKAHTPFQWFPVRKDADKSLKYLEKELRKIGVEFRPESYKWSVIQVRKKRSSCADSIDRLYAPRVFTLNANHHCNGRLSFHAATGAWQWCLKKLPNTAAPPAVSNVP